MGAVLLRWWPLAAFFYLLIQNGEAWAAGGAHVVDDAEVEQPGLCHAENWITGFDGGGGLLNIAPACTARSLPTVEFGGFLQQSWQDRESSTTAGPSLKIALRRVDRGLGVGVGASSAFDLASGRPVAATIFVPATADLSRSTRANVNVAYQWSRTGDRHALFVGAQVEFRPNDRIALMAEAFARDRGKPGLQAGLRWTPRPLLDLEMLVGRCVDGTSASAITFGLTIRG